LVTSLAYILFALVARREGKELSPDWRVLAGIAIFANTVWLTFVAYVFATFDLSGMD
jgi:hypothetical protein